MAIGRYGRFDLGPSMFHVDFFENRDCIGMTGWDVDKI